MRTFDIEYQTKKHLEAHMTQWPELDRAVVEKEIRQRLKSGNAWLWFEPWNLEQIELFGDGNVHTQTKN